jgi:hypothetical protein
MTSARTFHPVKDTATTARQLIAQVTVETDHLNRCILGEDPEKQAAEYLSAAYRAAHGEDMATLDAASKAAAEKLSLLHSDLNESKTRKASVPPELPPDRNDERPLMPMYVKAGIGLMGTAVPVIWSISVALVVSQLMEKYLHLATAPAMAILVAASVSIAPSLAIEFFLQTWCRKDAPGVKRLLSLTGALAAVGYIGIVSHMVKPELARSDAASVLQELGSLEFPGESPPANEPVPAGSGSTAAQEKEAATTATTPADPAQWFLFCALLCEMCVAAGLIHGIVHLFKSHRPLKLKPHPVRAAAAIERGELLGEIDEVSSDAAEIAGRRALHDHACELLIQEHTGRIRAARHFYETQRNLACL